MSNEKDAPGENRSLEVSIARDVEIARLGGKKPFADARKAGACVLCGKSPLGPFTDGISEREAGISQTCQACQDKMFADPEEDDEGVPDPVGLAEPRPAPVPRCDSTCPHFALHHQRPGSASNMCSHPRALVVFPYTSQEIPPWCPKVHEGADGDAARAGIRICEKCDDRYLPPKEAHRTEWPSHEKWCSTCAHYLRDRDKPSTIVQSGEHRMMYGIGTEPSITETYRQGLGHGGQLFRFRRLDGTVFESTNVWSAGAIPPALWGDFPVTATIEPVSARYMRGLGIWRSLAHADLVTSVGARTFALAYEDEAFSSYTIPGSRLVVSLVSEYRVRVDGATNPEFEQRVKIANYALGNRE